MALRKDLMQRMNWKFTSSTKVSLRYRSYDLVLVTNKEGNAIQLFLGKMNEQGIV